MRKPRQARKTAPNSAQSNGDRILIVTEGQKTEVQYFEYYVRENDLRNVKIPKRDSDSDPMSVVSDAIKARNKAKKKDLWEYTKIYCVIDEDNHEKFNKALEKMKAEEFISIVSIPSIEYWFLLHFIYSRSHFSSEECKKELKKHIPEYEKNMSPRALKTLYDKIGIAKKHAEKAMVEANRTGIKNPSTEVHLLIKELENFKKKN